jgi:uncharacterized DUF497 family protein
MVLAWDDRKNRTNRRKHGISFDTAVCAGGIAIVLVVHTSEEQHGEEKIRIVPARKASPRERALYHPHH